MKPEPKVRPAPTFKPAPSAGQNFIADLSDEALARQLIDTLGLTIGWLSPRAPRFEETIAALEAAQCALRKELT